MKNGIGKEAKTAGAAEAYRMRNEVKQRTNKCGEPKRAARNERSGRNEMERRERIRHGPKRKLLHGEKHCNGGDWLGMERSGMLSQSPIPLIFVLLEKVASK